MSSFWVFCAAGCPELSPQVSNNRHSASGRYEECLCGGILMVYQQRSSLVNAIKGRSLAGVVEKIQPAYCWDRYIRSAAEQSSTWNHKEPLQIGRAHV